MRHAHEVGIAKQSGEHVPMRFQIGNAVDWIKCRTPRNGLPQDAIERALRIFTTRTKQRLALRRPKQHTHEEVGMHDGIMARSQVSQLAAAVSLTSKPG